MIKKKRENLPSKKENLNNKVYEYKSINGIPDDYLDYLLVASTNKEVLLNILFKECESPLIKGLMCKYKVTKKTNISDEKLLDILMEFMKKDKKRELYNKCNSFNNTLLRRFLDKYDLDCIFNSTEEFMDNLDDVIQILEFPNLLSYIRTEREDLYDIAPILLAIWRKSERYKLNTFKDENYDFNEDMWLEKAKEYNLDIDFDRILKEDDVLEITADDLLDTLGNLNMKETIKLVKNYLDVIFKKTEAQDELCKKAEEICNKSDELEQDLKEKTKLLTKAEKKIKSNETKIDKLSKENEELNQLLSSANKKNESLELTLNEKNDKIEELKKEKKDNNKKNRELTQKFNKLQSEFDEYKFKQDEKEQDYLVKQEAVELIVNQNNELEAKCKDLEKELRELKLLNLNIKKSYEEEIELLKSKANEINMNKEIMPEVASTNEDLDDDFNYDNLFGDDLDNNPTY